MNCIDLKLYLKNEVKLKIFFKMKIISGKISKKSNNNNLAFMSRSVRVKRTFENHIFYLPLLLFSEHSKECLREFFHLCMSIKSIICCISHVTYFKWLDNIYSIEIGSFLYTFLLICDSIYWHYKNNMPNHYF